jgi:hypothetical protein
MPRLCLSGSNFGQAIFLALPVFTPAQQFLRIAITNKTQSRQKNLRIKNGYPTSSKYHGATTTPPPVNHHKESPPPTTRGLGRRRSVRDPIKTRGCKDKVCICTTFRECQPHHKG